VIAALGFGTAGFAVGDEVFGLTDQLRDGAAAEYVAVEARNVAPKPQTVDHVHAAAVPRAGLTAWQGLLDHGKLAKSLLENSGGRWPAAVGWRARRRVMTMIMAQ
jgi:NADPH:quinone reductase-like Zn-dependent oxidoreductase